MAVITESGVRYEDQEAFFRTTVDEDPTVEHFYSTAQGYLAIPAFGGLSGPGVTVLPALLGANRSYQLWQTCSRLAIPIPHTPLLRSDTEWEGSDPTELRFTMSINGSDVADYRLQGNGTVTVGSHNGAQVSWTEGLEWAQLIQRFVEEAQRRLSP